VITHLHETLDTSRGGQVSENLARIYTYLNQRLFEANVRKEAAPAREVEAHLRELLAAWEQAVRLAAPARELAGVAA
jgi:flagellar protein FliS